MFSFHVSATHRSVLLLALTGGGGLTSIIKVYTDMRLEGVYFSGLKVYEWISFSHQKYINGISFLPKKYMNG